MKVLITTLANRSKLPAGQFRRVRDSNGEWVTVRAVDAGSPTFGGELRGVFAKNVSKARRDNKTVTGVSDRQPAKR